LFCSDWKAYKKSKWVLLLNQMIILPVFLYFQFIKLGCSLLTVYPWKPEGFAAELSRAGRKEHQYSAFEIYGNLFFYYYSKMLHINIFNFGGVLFS